MIRTTSLSRRAGFAAAASVAGMAALAGCAGTTTPAATADPDEAESAPLQTGSAGAAGYADGTYSADGSYLDGGGTVETISVTVTLEGDVITDVQVTGDPQNPESERYQSEFIGGISGEVVGKDIDEVSVDRVAGSSLTSGGFNDALAAIRDDAAA
ncbi:FMN-binding protein [uncultured Microbacterium sp.]|uniref:FMN-binding domain-containing protein n=1 Tax=uncultured Microbacterium sp. TaxID=191216 RepID=A0A1Y5NUL3_9MICO|nr:FMN-binding protein [uncultured Microbacterium sp.]SBS70084.1 conserved exported hypothetical protein [uncultured Microbacterium sp.]